MDVEVRHAHHPSAASQYGTAELRQHFLIDPVFVPGRVNLVYSHLDRMLTGGVMPVGEVLTLDTAKPLGTTSFLARRELGIINVGAPGRVSVDGTSHELANRDGLYIGMGAGEVRLESADGSNPARFFLVSTPAHQSYPTVKISAATANVLTFGDAATANRRRVMQFVHPDICQSCQLVMGMTQLEPGNVWNTMPSHTHDRRSEVYLYFDLAPTTRIFHMMGEPNETRHILMSNEQAVLSPPWSIHSGVGTANYAFIWAMGGDNQDYRDMDFVPMDELR